MSGTASARGTARLLMVCAALTGLFFMHGLPAQSCPGGAGAPTAGMIATAAAKPTMPPDADRGMAAGAPTHHQMGHGVSATGAMTSEHGGVCVSTTPRRGLDTLVQLLLIVAIVLAVAAPLSSADPRPRASRALPRAGPDVLTRLCVSRT